MMDPHRMLYACPMKDGLACCGGTIEIITECDCHSCFRWIDLYDNPWDGFLSRVIAHERAKEGRA